MLWKNLFFFVRLMHSGALDTHLQQLIFDLLGSESLAVVIAASFCVRSDSSVSPQVFLISVFSRFSWLGSSFVSICTFLILIMFETASC